MKRYAADLWSRATEALRVAQSLLGDSSDNAASRAYYAAFNAVSALFALQEKTFVKHKEVEVAVHRDLVKPGRWPKERGKDFSRLMNLRAWGDYGGGRHVSNEEAVESIKLAMQIVEQVHSENPEAFPLSISTENRPES